MSDAHPPPHNGRKGVLASISDGLIRVLPPAFIALLVLNGIFLWAFDRNVEKRNELLTKIVDRCIASRFP
jgi:hypothetical protein